MRTTTIARGQAKIQTVSPLYFDRSFGGQQIAKVDVVLNPASGWGLKQLTIVGLTERQASILRPGRTLYYAARQETERLTYQDGQYANPHTVERGTGRYTCTNWQWSIDQPI